MSTPVWADVSEFQGRPLDASYPHKWFAFRSNDGTYTDPFFQRNLAAAKAAVADGRLYGFFVYAVYRPDGGAWIHQLIKNVGSPHSNMVLMLDMESWGGKITGDRSADINACREVAIEWIGDRRRVVGYGNMGDLDRLWVDLGDTQTILAYYSPTSRPGYPGKIAQQYTSSGRCAPWAGNVDLNDTELGHRELAAALGLPVPNIEEAALPTNLIRYQGKLVTPYMAWVLDGVNAWLKSKYKMSLVVRDGIRTDAEQERIFRDRYVTAGNVNGRHVYDVRRWNGVLWYRISAAGTVAVPGTSNHQIQGSGTSARAAVDIADSGNDAGITVKGSARGRAIRAAARALHIEFEGDSFGEGWHVLIRNIYQAVPGSGEPAGSGSSYRAGDITVSGVSVKDVQTRLLAHGYSVGKSGADNIMGTDTISALYKFQGDEKLTKDAIVGSATWSRLKASPAPKPKQSPKPKRRAASVMLSWRWTGIQRMLKAEYGYPGRIDNNPGPETKKASRRFLTKKGYSKRANGWGLAIKPIFNVNDVRAIQQWLRETKRDRNLVVDGDPGPKTHAAWDKAEAENGRAYSWVK